MTLFAFAVLVAILASGLRPDAFFAGDPGVKLIAARNAIARPSHPFDIPLPTIASTPVPFVEPFFFVHQDHSHAVTSELFPLISAPLLAAGGMRALYVLPALGFLLAIAACGWIGVQLDPRRRAPSIALVAGLTTPLLFYGLEFWEHAPAVACAALGTLGLIGDARFRRQAPGFSRDAATPDVRMPTPVAAPRVPPFMSGALFGVAILLRPEAAWFALAVAVCSPLLPHPPGLRAVLIAAAGALVTLAPLELHTLLHFGTLVPPHVATNAAPLDGGWLSGRFAYARTWFAGMTNASVWRAAPALAAALPVSFFAPARDGRRFLWSLAGIDTALVLLTAPNDGGAQWGPRYLLFSCMPLSVLAGDAIDTAWRRRPVALALAAAIFATGAWTHRTAYRNLSGTKSTYGRLVDFVRRSTGSSEYVVNDLWWLDQIAAAAANEREFLYADTSDAAAGLMRRLEQAQIESATVITSRTEPRVTGGWTRNTCFEELDRAALDVRDLTAVRVACRSNGGFAR